MFVWVINCVTKDSFREMKMHKIRLILQNPKISCCACDGCKHSKHSAGIFWSLLQPVSAAQRGKIPTARPRLSILDAMPCLLMIRGKPRKPGSKMKKASCPQAEEISEILTQDALPGHAVHRSALMESWPMSWPSGTHSLLQWEERGGVFQQYCGQTTSSSGSQGSGLILLAISSPYIHMFVLSPTPCLNEKSGPSWHEAAHDRCWAVNKTDAARGQKR